MWRCVVHVLLRTTTTNCINCINCIIIIINCTNCIISWGGGKPPPQTLPPRVPLFYILAWIGNWGNLSHVCRVANFQKMKFGTRRERRRDRDAVGVEGVGNGEGNPLPSRLGGLGASWAPPAGSGAEPKMNLGHIKRRRTPVIEGKSGI